MSEKPDGFSEAELMADAILIGATEPDPRVMTAFGLAQYLAEPERMAPAVLRAAIERRNQIALLHAVMAEDERQGIGSDGDHDPIIAALRPREDETQVDWFKRINGDRGILGVLVEGLVAGIVLGADLRFKVADAVDVKVGSVFVDLKDGEELTHEQIIEAVRESMKRAHAIDDSPEDDREPEEGASDG